MTLSVLGKQYICENFGDINLCCTNTGLSWYYTVGGMDYNESGGTAQIISRLASGLIESLTMTNPARGIFTQAGLNTANGAPVTLQDAQAITIHDEPTEDQWCFIPCNTHADQATCENIYNCYWYNGSCHAAPPGCTELNNPSDCSKYGCYWYNNSCHATWNCETINNQTECVNVYGCYWYNGTCHSDWNCEIINNQTECQTYGCYWYNGTCHSAPPACETLNNEPDCQTYGCYWYNGTCNTNPPSCETLNNEPDCALYGCYWYRGACHSINQPELCYWIDTKGGASALLITHIFEIIDAYVFTTPPTGWTFTPNINEVFGVIDYYLGFNGDAKTGCSYFT